MLELQTIQNDCLRFVYNKKRTDRVRADRLHNARFHMCPINQVLHSRGKSIWTSVRNRNAADHEMAQFITSMKYKEHGRYPSSLKQVHEYSIEPEPLYTYKKK